MRVLVTGADGFVVRHLVPVLQAEGSTVVGTALDTQAAEHLGIPVHPLDVTNPEQCHTVLQDVAPAALVHLAAVSSVRWSFAHPEETRKVNVEGTRNLLEAARRAGVRRVLVVGSAEEYGANDGRPLPELPLDNLRPLSPYAESKVAVERMIEAEPQFRALAVRTRSFPHMGPGQREGSFTPDVASQLVQIAAGRLPPVLRVGNTEAVRDYTDVRDVVRAYARLLEQGEPGEVYNVCSGQGVPIREILDRLLALAAVSVPVETDWSKVRPSEVPTLIGDATKLRRTTGWSPTIPLARTLQDIVAWWRLPEQQRSLSPIRTT